MQSLYKTSYLFLSLFLVIFLLGFQQDKNTISPKLLIGKWKIASEAFNIPTELLFTLDSIAKLGAIDKPGHYKYFIKKDTIFLKDSTKIYKRMDIYILTKDSLKIGITVMGGTQYTTYYREK